MKKITWTVLSLAALLGGCANFCVCKDSPSTNPVVVIDSRAQTPLPVVIPDPLHFTKNQTDVRVAWHLPPNSGLSFPENGITIDGEVVHRSAKGYENRVASAAASKDGEIVLREQTEVVDCKPASAVEFTCLNRHTRPGVYKYTVRVRLPSGQVIEQDPRMMND